MFCLGARLCTHFVLPWTAAKREGRGTGSIRQTLVFHDLPRSHCLRCSDASVQFSSKSLKAHAGALRYLQLFILGASSTGSKKRVDPPKSTTGKNEFCVSLLSPWNDTVAKLQTSYEMLILNICQMKELAFLSAGSIWVEVKTTVQEWQVCLPKGS